MRILDRYILRQYIITFLVIIASFAVIFVVIDVFDRLPRLLRKEAGVEIIASYFLMRLPYLFVLTSPVAVLLSGLFMMNTLSKYNETIAIRAAGISIVRMVTPLFWFALLFAVFVLLFGDIVLPIAESKRADLWTEHIQNQKVEDIMMRSNIHYRGADNNLYHIGFFHGYENYIKTIDITTFDHESGHIEKKITAANATWRDTLPGDPVWVASDCFVRTFNDDGSFSTQRYDTCPLPELTATPIDFVKLAKKPMAMNFFELKEYIGRLRSVGESYRKELTDLFFKIAFPFANFIIILFCVPLASASTRSKGRGWVFLIGLVICFAYLSALRVSQSLGYSGVLSPLTAAWLPNAVFGVAGVLFVIKAEV
ncbi:MAG: LptF/LptG family permease [Candidatus Cloacimonetes bacterium]|nr:LptF/LptG family permease [Candidatus Cloacimonadota bacterium]